MSAVRRVDRVPVGANGRLNLPVEMRRAMGVESGGTVTLEQDEDGVVSILSLDQRLAKVRKIMAPYITPGRLVSEELIAERRAENAKDEAELAEHQRLRRG